MIFPDATSLDQLNALRQERADAAPQIAYHYTSLERAREILSTGSVSFSSPFRFNDPFDGQWDLLWQANREEFRQRVLTTLRDILSGKIPIPSYFSAVRRGQIQTRLGQLQKAGHVHQDQMLQEDMHFAEQSLNNIGAEVAHRWYSAQRLMRIFCMCRSELSLQMWSYYGAHHRGVAIGFDVQCLEDKWLMLLRKVRYETKLPQMIDEDRFLEAVLGGADTNAGWRASDPFVLALVKEKHWEHEEEWRFAVGEKEPSSLGTETLVKLPVGCGCIRELVLGTRSHDHACRELKALAQPFNERLTAVKLQQHPSAFGLVRTAFA